MKRLSTGISPQYVRNWDITHAIRELFQNALDAQSEFGCKARYDFRNNKGTIQDKGPGLEPRHLAIGVSEKADTARGQFGEGLKLALLVFAREGREIAIRSNGKRIVPTLEHSEGFGTEVLTLCVSEEATPEGTQISFPCNKGEWETGKWYFQEFRRNNRTLRMIAENLSHVPGEIWVNGTLVAQDQNTLFGYHLEGREAINRDRSVVDITKVRPEMRRILAGLTDQEHLDTVLEAVENEDDYFEVKEGAIPYSMTDTAKRAWKQAFTRQWGKSMVLATGNDRLDNQLSHNGYEVVDLPWEWHNVAAHVGIPKGDEVADKAAKPKNVPLSKLTDEERKNLDTAIALCRLHLAEPQHLTVVEEIILNSDNPEQCARGVCHIGKEGRPIEITREVLESTHTTVKVLLHETLHQHTGFGDRTTEFEDAWADLCVRLMGVK